jgi:hypothetical protein
VLTDAGYEHLVAAAPGHVAAVRELVIDALEDGELNALQGIAQRIIARIDNPCRDIESGQSATTHARRRL